MRPTVASRAAVAAAAALALTACGGSPTASSGNGNDTAEPAAAENSAAVAAYERINALSGQERADELKKCAEEEGALSVYTSNTDIDDVVDGFEDEYDVDVSVYRGNSESVLQRLLQEQKARFYGNDILETNALELNVANKEGMLAPYESELREQVREEGQAENWTATRFNTFVVGWNTDLVKPGEEPKTLEELAEPKWKGKLSMEVGDVDWFTALVQHMEEQGKSEEEAVELFKKMAANSKTAKGHTVQGELLSAGQFAVAVSSYNHTIDKAADKGAPVAWQPASGEPVQPLVVRPNGIGLMKTAANPCAAIAFVDWELTGGQEVFEKKFRIGATAAAGKAIEGLDVVAVPEQELLDNGKKWDELYAEVIKAGSSS
jgi:iron(III) transport system substrate-binding protein